MKIFVSICILFILNVKPGFSQKEIEISGVKYLLYSVKKGETTFSLCERYKVTEIELQKANPGMTGVLKAGSTLKIPLKNTDEEQVKTAEKTADQSGGEFIIHKVVADETLYSLGRKYGVTQEELMRLNPSLVKGLQTGTIIKIAPKTPISSANVKPVGEAAITEKDELPALSKEPEPTNCLPLPGLNSQKYKVALLLPLYLHGNDPVKPLEISLDSILGKVDFSKTPQVATDSAVVFNGTNIDQRAQSFLEFYEGALLAIDSLQQKGMKLEFYVFDVTGQAMVNALLQLDLFRDLNLIVGPVYPELQESVASFAAKNRIPMVSPLAPNGNFEKNNSYYLKVNPTKEYQVEETANYIANEFVDKNFVLLEMSGNQNSGEKKLAGLAKEKLVAVRETAKISKDLLHEYSFQNQGVNGIDAILDKEGENIFMIPSDDEAQVSVAVTNLNALAERYNIVLIGTSNLTKMKSIQTENYHHIRLRYLSPNFVDYTKPLVRRFVGQYRTMFSGEPTQFSFQGFDVTYYFLSALYRYGKDFSYCLPGYPMQLTHLDFDFRKVSPLGGYMNTGLFVTAYERNYDILNKGIVASDQK